MQKKTLLFFKPMMSLQDCLFTYKGIYRNFTTDKPASASIKQEFKSGPKQQIKIQKF